MFSVEAQRRSNSIVHLKGRVIYILMMTLALNCRGGAREHWYGGGKCG